MSECIGNKTKLCLIVVLHGRFLHRAQTTVAASLPKTKTVTYIPTTPAVKPALSKTSLNGSVLSPENIISAEEKAEVACCSLTVYLHSPYVPVKLREVPVH